MPPFGDHEARREGAVCSTSATSASVRTGSAWNASSVSVSSANAPSNEIAWSSPTLAPVGAAVRLKATSMVFRGRAMVRYRDDREAMRARNRVLADQVAELAAESAELRQRLHKAKQSSLNRPSVAAARPAAAPPRGGDTHRLPGQMFSTAELERMAAPRDVPKTSTVRTVLPFLVPLLGVAAGGVAVVTSWPSTHSTPSNDHSARESFKTQASGSLGWEAVGQGDAAALSTVNVWKFTPGYCHWAADKRLMGVDLYANKQSKRWQTRIAKDVTGQFVVVIQRAGREPLKLEAKDCASWRVEVEEMDTFVALRGKVELECQLPAGERVAGTAAFSACRGPGGFVMME